MPNSIEITEEQKDDFIRQLALNNNLSVADLIDVIQNKDCQLIIGGEKMDDDLPYRIADRIIKKYWKQLNESPNKKVTEFIRKNIIKNIRIVSKIRTSDHIYNSKDINNIINKRRNKNG